jgi:anti-anti-sigma factor
VGRRDSIEFEIYSANLVIVSLCGEHDLGTAPEIKSQLSAASAYRDVLVDLSRCAFIDSSVISALLRASNHLHARGGLLSLVIPAGQHTVVRNVFELMSIERHMPTYDSRQEALAQLALGVPGVPPTRTRLRALSEIIDASLAEHEDQRYAA